MPLSPLLLSPVLIPQALWVMARATRLPEAAGPRQGRCGSGPGLRLLILGDSSAAGVGADHQDEALAGRLAAELGRSFAVEWRLLARSGATTATALEMLAEAPRPPFDAVLTVLGVNDVKNGVAKARWTTNYSALVDRLVADFGARRVYLSAVPPIGAFPLLPRPLRDVLGRRGLAFDRVLEDLAADRAEAVHLRPDMALDPDLMASDGFHPGPRIYARWAEEAAEAIRRDLAPTP